MEEKRNTFRKVRTGKVVSDKMDKTVVVIVEDHVAHNTYKKILFQVDERFLELFNGLGTDFINLHHLHHHSQSHQLWQAPWS